MYLSNKLSSGRIDFKRTFSIGAAVACMFIAGFYIFVSSLSFFGTSTPVSQEAYVYCIIAALIGIRCYNGGSDRYKFLAILVIVWSGVTLLILYMTSLNNKISKIEYAKYEKLCKTTVVGVNNQNIIPAAGPSEKFNDGKVEITLSKKIRYPLPHSKVFHDYKNTLLVTAKNLSDKTAEYTVSIAVTGPKLKGVHYAALRIDDVEPGTTKTINAFSDFLESSKHADILRKGTSFKAYSVRTRTKNAHGVLESDSPFHGVNILFNPTPEDLRGII